MNYNKRQDTTVFSLRIPFSLLKQIAKAAIKDKRTVSNLIRLTLEEKYGKESVR